MQSRTSPRGLSTARAALQVAWLLAARPEGVRADEVAETLGKSSSTAYNVLASLCEEGVAAHHAGGLYRLSPAFRSVVGSHTAVQAPELPDLPSLVDTLLARTHKRAYLGIVHAGELHVVAERGLQGMPKLPGLGPRIGVEAHALALGKVVLALAPRAVVERYVRAGLHRFSAHTITAPDALLDELDAVRERGFAVEREEFGDDFCCIAAPVLDARGRFVAAVGISMTRRAFDDEHEVLAQAVVAVAGAARLAPKAPPASRLGTNPTLAFQASAETPTVLDSAAEARLVWANGSTLP
jgi:acetyl-CoA synthetase